MCEPRTCRCKSWVWKRGRNQSSNCQHLLDHGESKGVSEKHLLLLHWLCKSFWLCGLQQTRKILKQIGVPDHLTFLLRYLYGGQEATVQIGYVTTQSVQLSHSIVSNSLQPYESQHARPHCPSQTPGVYSDSCQSSRWCFPAILYSVVPFASCPQSLPASGSFQMSQFFAWRISFRMDCNN